MVAEHHLSEAERTRRREVLAALAERTHNGGAPVIPPVEPGPAEAQPARSALPLLIEGGAPVDLWVATEDGLRRWRPIIDRLIVTPLPGGARILQVAGFTLRLDAETAAHIARLLVTTKTEGEI